jgi:two-component system chemotaxis sensor kinase CheA
MFRSLRGMSGSSILGNGEVALIFDVGSLGQLASAETGGRLPRAEPAAARGTAVAAVAAVAALAADPPR